MLCYADIIIKVKYVKRNEKDDAKVFTIWAIGTYPTGHENNEIEMILFLSVNPNDQDPESQAIFKKNEYYSVRRKIMPGSYAGQIRPKVSKHYKKKFNVDLLPID
ncbi:1019_t:CDS:1 [Cetraspora pellucida]|uniref:1019_t:CDS:1 n=1 Tax=Cetraspora pellucida TaxID=1433469 RepID=A0A9N8YTS9_9GLOM|nr:1019_t:CDS:1 [Cetraspora pellucida]